MLVIWAKNCTVEAILHRISIVNERADYMNTEVQDKRKYWIVRAGIATCVLGVLLVLYNVIWPNFFPKHTVTPLASKYVLEQAYFATDTSYVEDDIRDLLSSHYIDDLPDIVEKRLPNVSPKDRMKTLKLLTVSNINTSYQTLSRIFHSEECTKQERLFAVSILIKYNGMKERDKAEFITNKHYMPPDGHWIELALGLCKNKQLNNSERQLVFENLMSMNAYDYYDMLRLIPEVAPNPEAAMRAFAKHVGLDEVKSKVLRNYFASVPAESNHSIRALMHHEDNHISMFVKHYVTEFYSVDYKLHEDLVIDLLKDPSEKVREHAFNKLIEEFCLDIKVARFILINRRWSGKYGYISQFAAAQFSEEEQKDVVGWWLDEGRKRPELLSGLILSKNPMWQKLLIRVFLENIKNEQVTHSMRYFMNRKTLMPGSEQLFLRAVQREKESAHHSIGYTVRYENLFKYMSLFKGKDRIIAESLFIRSVLELCNHASQGNKRHWGILSIILEHSLRDWYPNASQKIAPILVRYAMKTPNPKIIEHLTKNYPDYRTMLRHWVLLLDDADNLTEYEQQFLKWLKVTIE